MLVRNIFNTIIIMEAYSTGKIPLKHEILLKRIFSTILKTKKKLHGVDNEEFQLFAFFKLFKICFLLMFGRLSLYRVEALWRK